MGNINYRRELKRGQIPSIQSVKHAVYDLKAAVRFVVRHADEYGIDPDRIATWGTSAGAIATTSMEFIPEPGDSGNPGFPTNVNAHVLLSGAVWPFVLGERGDSSSQSKP